jgi:hypothetical protein
MPSYPPAPPAPPRPPASQPYDSWGGPPPPPQSPYAQSPYAQPPPYAQPSPYSASYGAPPWFYGAGGVYVELRTDNPNVRIDRVVDGNYLPVCFAPCRKVLPRHDIYVITGDGVRSTSNFVLPDDRASVTLDVQAGSSARQVAGGVLMAGGIITAYVGLVVYAGGLGADRPASTTGSSSSQTNPGGMIAAGIGVGAALVGLFLSSTSHTTVVSSTGNTFTDATPPPTPPRKRAAVALTPRGLEF